MVAPKKKVIRKTSSKKKKTKSSFNFWKVLLFVGIPVLIFATWYLYSPLKRKVDNKSFLENIPEGFNSFGIDISHHQGEIDWDHLMKVEHFDTIIDFVYCKATEGSTHLDSQWENNRKALNNLGIANGAYHFLSTKKLPRPQVAHFLNHWKKREVDLPPVLDVETEGFSDDDLRKKMIIWLEEVEKQTGMRPIIYTSMSFFETKFKNYFPDYKFWIAAYTQEPGVIDDKRIIHWQYTEAGILPGIDEEVDFNVSIISF